VIPKTKELIGYGVYPSEVRDIDPEIRDIVLDLNRRGYGTVGSCAGHSSRSHGFISFSDYGDIDTFTGGDTAFTQDEKEEIRAILKEHGLTGIRFSEPGWRKKPSGKKVYRPWTYVYFNSVGKTKWMGNSVF